MDCRPEAGVSSVRRDTLCGFLPFVQDENKIVRLSIQREESLALEIVKPVLGNFEQKGQPLRPSTRQWLSLRNVI